VTPHELVVRNPQKRSFNFKKKCDEHLCLTHQKKIKKSSFG
jgi:hypothetical protein